MHVYRHAWLMILLVFCYSLVSAQTQYTGWLATFNTVKTGKRTSIHSDIQLRSSDEISHVQTLLIRAGLNVNLRKNLVATAGYALVHNRRSIGETSGYISEHRIWEQVLLTHKFHRILVSHRLRLEQRFIGRPTVESGQLSRDGHVNANRIRYFLRNIIPFSPQPVFKRGWFAALQNELFLNIGNTKNVNGRHFDQNRAYGAVGYRLAPEIDVEAGYLNQYIRGKTGRTNNHVAQVAMYLRL